MALDFSTYTNERYTDHGTLNNWAAQTGTLLVWVYPTDVSANSDQTIFYKGQSWDRSLWLDIEWSSGGTFKIARGRTTPCHALSNDTLSNNVWQFVAATWNVNGSNSDQKLFLGTLTSVVSEVSSYGAQTVGSGTISGTPNTMPLRAGDGSTDFGWETGYAGKIAWVGAWNRILTLGEIRAQQYRPHTTSGCLVNCHYGITPGSTQIDLSGNAYNASLSATPPTIANHIPIALPFTSFRRSTPTDIAGGPVVKSVTDSGAGVDTAPSLTTALGLTDSGAGADTLSQLVASLAITDSGAGADTAPSLTTALGLTDSGAGSDVIAAIAAILGISDSGTGASTVSMAITLSVSDTATGVDAIATITEALKEIADTGSGIDALTIATTLNVADAGVSADTPAIAVSLTVPDVASAIDAVSIIMAALRTVTDTGSGIDSIGPLSVQVPITDAGSAVEILAGVIALSVAETGAGVEIVSAFDATTQIVTITIRLTNRSVTFALKQRSILFTLSRRAMTFDLQ